MKLASAPFRFRAESYLGKIYRPYIITSMSSKKLGEWIPVEMLVDTGADYTLLPHKYAGLLGIDVSRACKAEKTFGIGGGEKIYLCKNSVMIKIGSFEKKIPVGFLTRDDVPALLGRLEALEVLRLIMDDRVTIFEI